MTSSWPERWYQNSVVTTYHLPFPEQLPDESLADFQERTEETFARLIDTTTHLDNTLAELKSKAHRYSCIAKILANSFGENVEVSSVFPDSAFSSFDFTTLDDLDAYLKEQICAFEKSVKDFKCTTLNPLNQRCGAILFAKLFEELPEGTVAFTVQSPFITSQVFSREKVLADIQELRHCQSGPTTLRYLPDGSNYLLYFCSHTDPKAHFDWIIHHFCFSSKPDLATVYFFQAEEL